MKFGAVYCLYDDHEYLDSSLELIKSHLDKVLFLISDVPWNGKQSDNSETINKVKQLCKDNKNFELIQGHWMNEIDQRNFGLSRFFIENIDYYFVIDNDEIYHEQHFINIKDFIKQNSSIDAFHIEWDTYWKDFYVIRPRENFKPVIAVKVNHFLFTIIRGGTTAVIRSQNTIFKTNSTYYNAVVIPSNIAICHHLSYARDDEKTKRKYEINSHNPEFITDWYENIWMKWAPKMQNLHPVTPEQYKNAVCTRFTSLPVSLQKHIDETKKKFIDRKCSIIILNWNSCNLLKMCLELVYKNTFGTNYEIIIVDNGSTKDDSVKFIEQLKYKAIKHHTIFNKKNIGFAPAINQAIKQTKDTDICLLNVDAEVQQYWLSCLYMTMTNNDAGIVGPLGNEVASGHQKEGYVQEDTITPNLYGYCMLINRELIDKIGYFDEQYEIGGYEDNDYCIRSKLAGYETYISARSLVRHKAHQVFEINGIDHYKNDDINREKYLNKFYGVLLEYAKHVDLYSNKELAKYTGIICQ